MSEPAPLPQSEVDELRRGLIESLLALERASDPLERVAAARSAREDAEVIERSTVRQARAEGASWAKIGAVFGLTKQGAQQRFAGARARSNPGKTPSTSSTEPDSTASASTD